ncbi:hypothetical protein CQ12_06050 [Bradyrhizobium jicamae]|uniref:SF3 helicase domain-containing protein n=1 Tax=Bradyrhizobium jicamae TaxID=280332 RepID=A0A0R3LQB8_9BRAD|nr:phage/plasmid primase, P4 family [Bradyrhizobium jicamae]KRR09972.1 hypothetical protein CQ12_06050 [Bradyrhizobium jicamae]
MSYNESAVASTDFFDERCLEWAERRKLWLFPVYAHSKNPAYKWKTESSPDRKQWEAWLAEGYMLGINAFMSGKLLLDLDVGHVGQELALIAFADFLAEIGSPWLEAYCISPSGGYHFMVDRPADVDPEQIRGLWKPRMTSHARPLADGEKDRELISVRNRGYCVAPGSAFGAKRYVLTNSADKQYDCTPGLLEKMQLPVVEYQAGTAGQSDPDDIAAVIAALDARGEFDDEESWKFTGLGAIKLALGDTETAREVARQITWKDVDEDEFLYQWDRMDAAERPGKSYRRVGTLIRRAEQLTGRKFHVRKSAAAIFAGVATMVSPPLAPGQIPPCPVPLPPPPGGALMPRGGTLMGPRGEVLPMDADDSLALDFAGEHVRELRHCEEWGRWLRWDGARWQTDKTARAYNLVREHLRKMGSGMHLQDARKILSAKTVAAVERMAKTDPRIATEAAIWDADPWLLNTPGGVIDLRTCVIRESRPDDHMTKSTAVAAGGDCPTWKAFLHKSLAGDAELIGFVQRMLGYALTGDTREQVLFFLYGQGGNGKGVLLNTVAGILADYAKTAPMATFTDSANAGDRHPTDLAGLRGSRFVMASETEKGRKWAESKIKSLTGGDPISARFMGRDFFEYIPTFKLIIAGNHKPRLSTVDEAIRRRMNMIPFTVQIPAAERDAALPERLKAEWGGILQWMVEGCLAWQRDGLQPPAAVRAATEEYLSGQDALATWLDERCEQAIGTWAARTELFASWSGWANNARERIGNATEFYEALASKGFEASGRNGARGFKGVRLRPITMPPVPER